MSDTSSTPPPFPEATANELRERLERSEREAAENLAGWQRARADYQNLKKECESKQAQFMADAKEMILEEFLPSYDHLKQAVRQAVDEAHLPEWRRGIEQITEQWWAALKRLGVEAVPTVHHPFNPAIHEAVDQHAEGDTVVREVQGGYTVNGRLLYPARVVVGPARPAPSPPSDGASP